MLPIRGAAGRAGGPPQAAGSSVCTSLGLFWPLGGLIAAEGASRVSRATVHFCGRFQAGGLLLSPNNDPSGSSLEDHSTTAHRALRSQPNVALLQNKRLNSARPRVGTGFNEPNNPFRYFNVDIVAISPETGQLRSRTKVFASDYGNVINLATARPQPQVA
jgi:hypothetical protein